MGLAAVSCADGGDLGFEQRSGAHTVGEALEEVDLADGVLQFGLRHRSAFCFDCGVDGLVGGHARRAGEC